MTDSGLTRIFDVDASLEGDSEEVVDEHMQLSKYLKDRVLTVDIWNGDSLMHFGTCKVPMSQFMRQGEPSKVVAQEYDICEPEFGQQIGGLQLLVSNEGRKVYSHESPSKEGA